jgi:hypothetical protein
VTDSTAGRMPNGTRERDTTQPTLTTIRRPNGI